MSAYTYAYWLLMGYIFLFLLNFLHIPRRRYEFPGFQPVSGATLFLVNHDIAVTIKAFISLDKYINQLPNKYKYEA